jgi:hypothetical protein
VSLTFVSPKIARLDFVERKAERAIVQLKRVRSIKYNEEEVSDVEYSRHKERRALCLCACSLLSYALFALFLSCSFTGSGRAPSLAVERQQFKIGASKTQNDQSGPFLPRCRSGTNHVIAVEELGDVWRPSLLLPPGIRTVAAVVELLTHLGLVI